MRELTSSKANDVDKDTRDIRSVRSVENVRIVTLETDYDDRTGS